MISNSSILFFQTKQTFVRLQLTAGLVEQFNELNGTIPVDFGFMKQITYFQIPSAPLLRGTLPTEIGMINSLGEGEKEI